MEGICLEESLIGLLIVSGRATSEGKEKCRLRRTC